MIYAGENKSVICKGNFHPAALYKGNRKLSGYVVTDFGGEGKVTLKDCYNDKVYDFVQNSSVGSITVRGKNILDMSKHTVTQGYYLDSSGNANSSNTNFVKISQITVEPSTAYTISSNLYFYTIWFYKGSSDSDGISRITAYDMKKRTFTTPENCTRIRVSFDIRKMISDEAQGTALFKWAMLEIGEGDGIYEPYTQPQTVSVENGQITADIPTFKGTTVIEIESDESAAISGKYKKTEV